MSRFRLKVSTLGDDSKQFNIPRFRFKVYHHYGFTLIRTQFPVGLAYAMTKCKSQGQSLQYSVNDIRKASFGHGMEYVALSRPTDIDEVCILCDEEQVENGEVVITNMVYPELFLNS